jgi:hypothetical protein
MSATKNAGSDNCSHRVVRLASFEKATLVPPDAVIVTTSRLALLRGGGFEIAGGNTAGSAEADAKVRDTPFLKICIV